MLATIAAADSASTVIKKYSVFIYSEAEPHAKYAIYKHTRKFRVLQYIYLIDCIINLQIFPIESNTIAVCFKTGTIYSYHE